LRLVTMQKSPPTNLTAKSEQWSQGNSSVFAKKA